MTARVIERVTATRRVTTIMSLDLPIPTHFPAFPYDPPYSIQVDLMRHLYEAIEQRKVAIVESPTGTVTILVISFTKTEFL